MTKDEMKNRISLALKDPILQQGFEIICKNLAEELVEENAELEKENARLKEKLKPENCLKLLAKDGYIKFTSEQLTKAKEIIKNLIDELIVIYGEHIRVLESVEQAEKFLKE